MKAKLEVKNQDLELLYSPDWEYYDYYQTLSNLHDALEVLHVSSYGEYNELNQTLYRLYTYILRNKDENYEIYDKLTIFTFLGKVLVDPDYNQLIFDFNSFLDSKSK